MKSRWDVFSDPRWTKGKSTYAVWFLHMLTYFIEVVMPRLQRVEAIHQHAPYQEPERTIPEEPEAPQDAVY